MPTPVQGLCLSLFPPTIPFPKQVALHQRADVIIGVHGAGLANVLWARHGCHVVEVRQTDTASPAPLSVPKTRAQP